MNRLKRWAEKPHTYLLILALLTTAALLDSFRHPQNQISAVIYIGLVRQYQAYGRPLTRKVSSCPYRPTCSRYSIEAVERHGIRRGLTLTLGRLLRCNGSAEMGTEDAVPTT